MNKKPVKLTCGRCGKPILRSEPAYRAYLSTDIFWNSDIIDNFYSPAVFCKQCAELFRDTLTRVDDDG